MQNEIDRAFMRSYREDGTALSEPPDGPITTGPVLALDIDGVVSPCAQDGRYNISAYPEGFINIPRMPGGYVQVHPSLPDWLAALEEAFTACVWVSTWAWRSRWLPDALGLPGPARWPYIHPMKMTPPHFTGEPFDFYKLEAARGWIDPTVPLALVDDHLGGEDCEYKHKEEIALFQARPGPTLLVAPDTHIGLTGDIVETLCRFADAPTAPAFAQQDGVLEVDQDWSLEWPWEVKAGGYHDNPVRVHSDAAKGWGEERKWAQHWREKYLRERKKRERLEARAEARPPRRWPYALYARCKRALQAKRRTAE